ncbi:lipoprotein [Pseudomonas asuensis]|uniref:Lipoprotein n=1 Tax=Pseudomonas asuensis TaxID=1825787 RepID=A0ABQ2GY46_9PSED|nr:Ca2+-dependent phosphoinositide-specific phospholipase C [Pseudomonas asuensis]GGM17079.1 lipoprotein [Pseudomonas asuensis]
MSMTIASFRRTLLACGFGLTLLNASVHAADSEDSLPLQKVQLPGSHNTYEKKDTFNSLADAFSYVRMIEIDVWAQLDKWYVSHSNPVGNDNNCPKSGVVGSDRNQDLRSCIDTIAAYHRQNPNHPLLLVKFELKGGFFLGNSPQAFDNLIADIRNGGANARIPERDIFTPLDLRCGKGACTATTPTLERVVADKGWPSLNDLKGKIMFMIVPGTVSDSAPREYARALSQGLARLAFPALIIKDQDTRTSYFGNDIGWNVILDIQAGRLDGGTVAKSVVDGYHRKNMLLSINDEAPGGTPVNVQAGRQRLQQLARDYHANIVNTDQETSGIPYVFALP